MRLQDLGLDGYFDQTIDLKVNQSTLFSIWRMDVRASEGYGGMNGWTCAYHGLCIGILASYLEFRVVGFLLYDAM